MKRSLEQSRGQLMKTIASLIMASAMTTSMVAMASAVAPQSL